MDSKRAIMMAMVLVGGYVAMEVSNPASAAQDATRIDDLLLEIGNAKKREHAIGKLVDRGDVSLPKLILALEHPDTEVRTGVAIALTKFAHAAKLIADADKARKTPSLCAELKRCSDRLYGQANVDDSHSVATLGRTVAKTLGAKELEFDLIMKIARAQGSNANNRHEALHVVLSILKEGEAISLELKDRDRQAKALANQGVAQATLRELERAAILFRKAIEVAPKSQAAAMAWIQLGGMYEEAGNNVLASECMETGVALWELQDAPDQLAIALSELASVNRSEGKYSRALLLLDRALKLLDPKTNRNAIGYALHGQGASHAALNNDEKALDAFQRAMSVFMELGRPGDAAVAKSSIGIRYMETDRPEEALKAWDEAFKMIGGPTDIAPADLRLAGTIQENVGEAYLVRGMEKEARRAFDQASMFYKTGKFTGDIESLKERYAQVAIHERAFADGLLLADEAVNSAKRSGSQPLLWQALTTKAKCYRGLNQPGKARQALDLAVSLIEEIRIETPTDAEQNHAFLRGRLGPYHEMIDLLVSQGNDVEALRFAEKIKARLLLDLLQRGRAEITTRLLPAEVALEARQRHDFQALKAKLAWEEQRSQPDAKRLKDYQQKLEHARKDMQQTQSELHSRYPDLGKLRGTDAEFNEHDMRQLLQSVQGALIQFVVTETKTHMFVVTLKESQGNKSVNYKSFTVEIPRKELQEAVGKYQNQLARRVLGHAKAARELYDRLIKPLEKHLIGQKALIIVPDQVLWGLPFQALQSNDGRYLLQDWTVSYAPSFTALHHMMQMRDKRMAVGNDGAKDASRLTLLGTGAPSVNKASRDKIRLILPAETLRELPEAASQIKTLRKAYGLDRSTELLGPAATKKAAKLHAVSHNVLHFATHGFLNDADPLGSALLLASDEPDSIEACMLTAREVLGWRLPKAELIVLAACQTGRGRITAGEGIVGTSWAWFVAGSPATVVSQWSVESGATEDLMVEFHRGVLKADESKAAVLQRSARRLLEDERYRDYRLPFYWAGFVLIGDPR